jgi:hypothetical protein
LYGDVELFSQLIYDLENSREVEVSFFSVSYFSPDFDIIGDIMLGRIVSVE